MSMIEYTLDEHVALVTMNHGENRFSYDFFNAFHQALDELERDTKASVLVVSSAHEKIWSNGIDLDWLLPMIQEKGGDFAKAFSQDLVGLYRRILAYPMITVAAINGHAFAGGAILAASFDFRFMRSDRGYFCLPEVDIGIPLMPSMVAIMEKAVPMDKFWEMQFTGARLTGSECEERHIARKAVPLEELMDEVMAFVRPLRKRRDMLAEMKKITIKEIFRIIDEDDPAWLKSGRTGLG